MAERWFLDACDPGGFVAGFDAYLTYCDGRCVNTGGGPFGALAVISSRAQCGRIGDCEPLNPLPAVWAAIGMPVVYCAWDGLSSFFDGYKESDVLAAYDAAGVPRPHLWVARPGWNTLPFWRPEIIAVQTGLMNAYDISLTDDAGLAIILGGGSTDMFHGAQDFDQIANQIQGIGGQPNPSLAYFQALLQTVQGEYNTVGAVKSELDAIKAEIDAGGGNPNDAAVLAVVQRIETALKSA